MQLSALRFLHFHKQYRYPNHLGTLGKLTCMLISAQELAVLQMIDMSQLSLISHLPTRHYSSGLLSAAV